MKDVSLNLLGDLAFNKKTNNVIVSRVNKLTSFLIENSLTVDDALDNVKIEVNNNWSNPPAPSTVYKSCHIGGTTYKYQIWAVIRK